MSDWFFSPTPGTRYRVHLLRDPQLSRWGVAYLKEDHCGLLLWGEVEHAMAAELGEPEGVRTIVFDLLARDGDGWLAHRFDAEPGEEAMDVAIAIANGLGHAAQDGSIKSIATDGIPTRWYPDIESFERETLHLLEGVASS